MRGGSFIPYQASGFGTNQYTKSPKYNLKPITIITTVV